MARSHVNPDQRLGGEGCLSQGMAPPCEPSKGTCSVTSSRDGCGIYLAGVQEKLKARLEEEVSNVVGRDLLRHTRDTRRNGSKRRRSSARIITNRPHPSVLNSSATLQSIPHLRSPVSPGELYDEVTQGACLSSFSLSCYVSCVQPTSSSCE